MLNWLGCPLSGFTCRRRAKPRAPTAREWRQIDRDQADADLLRWTATWLQEDPCRALDAGLSHDEDAHALAALLKILATGIASIDSGIRRQAIESCRVLLGRTTAAPSIRRSRHR